MNTVLLGVNMDLGGVNTDLGGATIVLVGVNTDAVGVNTVLTLLGVIGGALMGHVRAFAVASEGQPRPNR